MVLAPGLWSAAACCRFFAASLLAAHLSTYRARVHGQQAGPALREKRQQAAVLQSVLLPASAGPTPARRTSTKTPEASAASAKPAATPTARASTPYASS